MAPLAEAFVRVRPSVDKQEFRRETERAMRESAGSIKVTLDGSQIRRDLTALSAEVAKLRGKDLTINVDVTKAYVDVVTLREEIDKLGRQRPTVRADADTGAAMGQVAALIAEVERLGRLNPTIRPDVDDSGVRSVGAAASDSAGNVSWLAAAGVALGPALVPGAAAGAQAIAGITPMAIGAAAGIGVLALAVSGVVGAVKAMSAADNQATQSGVSLAAKQLQLASASDAVGSAQSTLANTVANAADAQRRASQTISTAELSEANAHRALLQAQQAITQARIDAARAAEDLSSRVAHNALDQRQATLDTTKAEQALAAARAAAGSAPGDPNAKRALDEAQLAYDQQKQRNTDLVRDAKQLTEDKAKSDKAGINGSSQVVSALDQVRQATDQVHQAEQATASARIAYTSQARQSAASIAQAQQGVINAQRSLEAATVSSATAGGAAMLALQQQIANLSPEGQRFATFIYGLRTPLLDLRRTAEAGLLPGAQAGIESLVAQMPRATDYTRRYATAVGDLSARAGEAFTQPYWLNFADLLVDKSIPAMDTGARVAYNLALAASGLVRAAVPLGQDFGGGLLRFSQDFAAHALTVQNTAGYRDFLDYVRTEGPIVARTVGEVVQAAVRLVEAIAPLGGVSLGTIRLLAETINALPVPVLTALAGGIGGVILVSKGLTLVRDLWFSAFGIQFVQMMTNARIAMDLAATQGAGRLATGLAGARGAAGTLASAIGPGGVLGVALVGAAILAGVYAQRSAEQRTRVDNLTQALGALGEAYKKTHDLGSQSVRDVVLQSKELSNLTLKADQYGISVEQIARAAGGERDAQRDVTTALDSKAAALQAIIDHERASGAGESGRRNQAQHDLDQLNEQRNALKGKFGELSRNADITRLLADANGQLSASERAAADEALRLTPAQKALNDALKVVGDTSSTVTEKIKAATTAYEAQWKAEMDVTEAQEAAARATDSMTETITRNKDILNLAGGSLDLNAAKNREQRQAILDSRDAIEAATLASVTRYQADVAGGVPMAQATQAHHDRIAALIGEATQSGANKEQVRLLVEQYGRVPGDVETSFKTSGIDKVYEDLRNLKAAQMAIEQGITPAEALGRLNRDAYYRQIYGGARAAGGPIYGPGGPTADMVPAIGPGGVRYQLSDGEWITRAKAVDYYGGDTMAAINAMAIPRETLQQIIGRARGGPVFHGPPQHAGPSKGPSETWPFVLDASKTKIPQIAAGLGAGGGNIGWQAMWNQLHAALPWVQLFSAFRPGDMAEHGLSYHAFGRAIDVTPDMRVVNWARAHWGTNLKELIHTPAGDRQVWNGRDHVFTGAALQAAHYNHVHLAMAKGGLVGARPVNQLSMDTGFGVLERGDNIVHNGTGSREPIAAGPIELGEYSLQRLAQILLTRPNRVQIVGPNDWGLTVPGVAP